MSDLSDTAGRAAVEAGAGRPFRFSLVLGEGRGRLLHWLGGRWAAGLGALEVSAFGAAGMVLGVLWKDAPAPPEAFLFGAAGAGAVFVAVHLRPRTVLFERREGTWCWRERWNLARLGWSAITDERPLRIEREMLTASEVFTIYADTVRLFSYFGDPATGRSVAAAFHTAGVPLRVRLKRSAGG